MIDLQIMGQFNRARELFENHLSFTKDHKDSMTLYHIYSFVALYDLFNRDWEDAVKVLDKYIPIVKGFGDPVFILTADVYYHIAQAFLGTRESFDQAIQLMNVCFDIGFKAFAVTMSSLIAELYLNLKEYDNALQWIDKILDHAQQTGSNINNSELLRIKGLVYHAQGKPVQLVEETFLQALEKARKSSAKLFELRVLVDLTKFWHETGSSKDGAKMLNNIVGSFNYEGVSPDIENARAILKLQKPNDK